MYFFILFLYANVVETIIIISKGRAMGLFFHEQDQQYAQRGTSNWANLGRVKKQSSVKGLFLQRDSTGVVNLIEMNSDDQTIYFYQNQNVRALELNLTVLQDHFYYNQHQSKTIENLGVYEIKLKKENLLTIIFTENLDTFVTFYKHLARYTILNCFEKHYKLTKCIGQGSSSKVYTGQNIFSKQQVALKIFQKKSANYYDDQNTIIVNQISNLERLRKFKLSPLIGVYQTIDCIILVLQKAEAGNMLDYLQLQAHNYNYQLVKTIIYKVLQNLKELHSAGFIHRDIKPENILFNNFSSNSALFLADFGSSVMKKDCHCSRIGRISQGTLGFIAPQIIKSNFYDEKCDLFSVGSLFYFLLKGESLFCGKEIYEIYQMVSDDKIIERKLSYIQNINKQGKDLLTKLLKVNPQERISATQALQHQIFSNMVSQTIIVGQQNYTLGDYIHRRVEKFFQ